MTVSEHLSVTLGGVDYPVPPVAFREVSKILPIVNAVFVGVRSGDMSETVLEGLGKVIYYGIKRGTKDLSYDEFIDRPASVSEMIEAAMVVCRQAGLKMKDSEPGEAQGASSPQTSMS